MLSSCQLTLPPACQYNVAAVLLGLIKSEAGTQNIPSAVTDGIASEVLQVLIRTLDTLKLSCQLFVFY